MKVTAGDIVTAIGQLPKRQAYNYVNPSTRTKIKISHITYPEGPIHIRRYNPSKGKGSKSGKIESISTQMIRRIANAISPNTPINFDRVVGASYNTRSALEALLAHTPEFYYCRPGRIEIMDSSSKIRAGHKHLLWNPEDPHKPGKIFEKKTDIVISEIPSHEAVYEALTVPDVARKPGLDIKIQRRHAQIQVALIMVGLQLGYRVWIAQNDRAIVYKNQKIGEIEGVIGSLYDEKILSAFDDAVKKALLIDCIWFRNNRFMPAVLEIEHTTGIKSGLVRMKSFQDSVPPFDTRYVIVAPDEDRAKVLTEANAPQFKDLKARFMSFSDVEELYSLCQRRKLKGVQENFLDNFMAPCLGPG